jgi:hypothetical protein
MAMTRPFRSSPITGPSPLLRGGVRPYPAHRYFRLAVAAACSAVWIGVTRDARHILTLRALIYGTVIRELVAKALGVLVAKTRMRPHRVD